MLAKQKANLWGAKGRVHMPVFLTNAQLIVFYDSSPETPSLNEELPPPTIQDPRGNLRITHIWAKLPPHRKWKISPWG